MKPIPLRRYDWPKVAFATLPIGAKFMCNGTHYIKRTTSTAKLVNEENDRVFYCFRQSELCYHQPKESE